MEEQLIVVIAAFEGPEEARGVRNKVMERLKLAFSADAEIKKLK